MESLVPPSYEEATTKDHWAIIARYIQSSDLCAACLVCRRWDEIFAPCLWGNPASHFGTENDRVYGEHLRILESNDTYLYALVALTTFKRTLPRARLSVRQLTHTLHLPPAQSELYDGPHTGWLRDVLEHLPNLQSLIVSELPFFDHSALLALRRNAKDQDSTAESNISTFRLRLLIATNCSNTTSTSLAAAFLHWPNLVFLDLSNTLAARDPAVLSSLSLMKALQVLKLRHVQLRDEDVAVLATAFGLRVRSLDIRDNRITDASIRTLLSLCFHPMRDIQGIQRQQGRFLPDAAQEDWPAGMSRNDSYLKNDFRGEDLDDRFLRRLTQGVVSRLPSEDLLPTGLTHLYISNNFVSVEGLTSLVKTQNLHVLDAGSVDAARSLARLRTRSSVSRQLEFSNLLPGVEKLTPVLEEYASENLAYLRIHYAVVTETPPVNDDVLSPHELHSEEAPKSELEAVDNTWHELGDAAPLYEMPEGSTTPLQELPANPFHAVAATLSNGNTDPVLKDQIPKRGSMFAPELDVLRTVQDLVVKDEIVILSATGFGPSGRPLNGDANLRVQPRMAKHFLSDANSSIDDSNSSDLERRIAMLDERSRQLRQRNVDHPRGLSPGGFSALQTLVLTDIPSFDTDGHVVSALKSFIQDCAEEVELADLRASIQHTVIQNHGGRPRYGYHRRRARELFPLRRIVLEMAPLRMDPSSIVEGSLSPRTPKSSGWKQKGNSSAMDDPDTVAFWVAAENDFSFFGEEECGVPADEPALHFPLSSVSEKIVLPIDNLQAGDLPVPQQTEKPNHSGLDVVQALTEFRKQRKAAYESVVNMGNKYVQGYWPGEVKVVRSLGSNQLRGGNLDYYGNYFVNGIYR